MCKKGFFTSSFTSVLLEPVKKLESILKKKFFSWGFFGDSTIASSPSIFFLTLLKCLLVSVVALGAILFGLDYTERLLMFCF
jgi:hypothetical protein